MTTIPSNYSTFDGVDLDSEIFDALFRYTDIDNDVEPEPCSKEQLRPSYEQQTVINHLLDGDNVVVDSVSGSGKSTTISNMITEFLYRKRPTSPLRKPSLAITDAVLSMEKPARAVL